MSIMSNAKRALAIAAAAATLLSMAACGSSNAASGKSDSSGAASSGKIEVVASINQWGSVAEDLGGSNVEVTNIMTKTNVEAHDYEPTSQDVAKFGTAKAVVVAPIDGVGHQGRPADQGHAGHRRRNRRHQNDNPHVWFSAKVRSNTADAITATCRRPTKATKDIARSTRMARQGKTRGQSQGRLPPRPRACRTPPPNPWPGTWPTTSR